MPIFAPDFSAVDANIPIYEKGRYRVQINKRTPTMREKNDGNGKVSTSVSVRYALEMVGAFDDEGNLLTGGLKGKTVQPYNCWVHSEGGWKMAKSFIMAACGYNVKKQEGEANVELFQKHSWRVQGEIDAAANTFELGDGWDLLVGRLVDVTLSVKADREDKAGDKIEEQDFGGWTPVEG